MTDIDLNHIRTLVETNSRDLASHVPALLAEVERLRRVNAWTVDERNTTVAKLAGQVQAVQTLADGWIDAPADAPAEWFGHALRAALDTGSDS